MGLNREFIFGTFTENSQHLASVVGHLARIEQRSMIHTVVSAKGESSYTCSFCFAQSDHRLTVSHDADCVFFPVSMFGRTFDPAAPERQPYDPSK